MQAEQEYFRELEDTCAVVGAGLWGRMEDDDFVATPAGLNWVLATYNVEPVYASSASGPSNGSSAPPPAADTMPPYWEDYAAAADAWTGPDSPAEPPPPPPEPSAPPPAPAAAPPSSGEGAAPTSGVIKMLKRRVPEFSPAVAAWATINATVTAMDVAINSATVSFEMRVQSAVQTRISRRGSRALDWVQYPALLDRTGRVRAKDMRVKTDVVSSTTDNELSLKTGDRVFTRKLDIPLTPTTSLYMYPFDKYTGTITMVTTLTAADVSYPVALVVQQKNAVVGWVLEARLLPTIEDNRNVYNFSNPTGEYRNPDSSVTLTYTINLKRTSFVQFFSVFVLIGLWVVSCCSFGYAMDMLFIRPRNAAIADANLFTTQLFAVVGTRNIMPGVPAVGVGVDFYGIIWIMLLCLFTGGLVYARIVSQYVHKEPTLYDRLTKNEAWTDGWLAKQEAKEKLEKAKKEAEGERRERIAKYGMPGSRTKGASGGLVLTSFVLGLRRVADPVARRRAKTSRDGDDGGSDAPYKRGSEEEKPEEEDDEARRNESKATV
ncbi:hypothetical protein HYH03_014401 [Edaphochlamys debaryana]|uniref:Uncharacterized protein n=1 Tax=Edaphochlamys debaryana TaxID=47281 RepID=A0A835XN18_9CHLO|nr:hypothetical protein HYH03_014401 [Edaphochlamys debaryana]|eukprot:KAG2486901.1 hypothetical protein HYH03_014401 [Edaphochlamys debaryana]